jgi:hypothetical protein
MEIHSKVPQALADESLWFREYRSLVILSCVAIEEAERVVFGLLLLMK